MIEVVAQKLWKFVVFVAEAVKYIVLTPVARLVYRNRKIFLFAERGTDARDNGYHMYRYFREQHPELESYYVITRNSADYEKVNSLGNAVIHSSLKHYFLFLVAEYKISTHIMGFSTNIGFYIRFADILRLPGHRIFLQHGVIKDYIRFLCRQENKVDLFICGAKPEYDYIRENFGHPQGVVQYTGLARYDRLHDYRVKNQILVMPTWRESIKTKKQFLASNYFRNWQSFISNGKLIQKLEETDTELVFYVHYEMQKYINCFNTKSDRVILARFADYDVQTLLKESKLLITDYSSVFFDFAYMRKPIVYYLFDDRHKYGKGYFDIPTMGFGDVCDEEETVIQSIVRCFENDFKMEPQYLRRAERFFPLHDENNRKRIYDAIMEI